jgi:hypothetical protein
LRVENPAGRHQPSGPKRSSTFSIQGCTLGGICLRDGTGYYGGGGLGLVLVIVLILVLLGKI